MFQIKSTANELNLIDDLDEKLRRKIQNQLKIGFKFLGDLTRANDTPYTTVVHRDLWINYVMIKKGILKTALKHYYLHRVFFLTNNMDGPIKIKIYNSQLYFYQSFMHDLIFFLFTSVCSNDLAKDFKLFIRCYHAEFVKTLKLVNCPLDDYTYEKY